jgi:hypothetical protein
MKNCLLVACFIFFTFTLIGQSFFAVGANYSTLSFWHTLPFGKQKPQNFKLTPSIGYGYRIKLNKNWYYQPGLSFGDLGMITFRNQDKANEVIAIYAITLNQSVGYKITSWFSVGLSPSVNYNLYAGISGKKLHASSTGEVTYSENVLINWKDASPSHKLNRFVFSIIPRFSFHLKERWSLDIFYRSDLNSVGYPSRILNYELKGYGIGANLKYYLKTKKSR